MYNIGEGWQWLVGSLVVLIDRLLIIAVQWISFTISEAAMKYRKDRMLCVYVKKPCIVNGPSSRTIVLRQV